MPFNGQVLLQRTPEGVATNLPIVIAHHSPTGIEWGYGGSGPADLALSILNAFIPANAGQHTERCWSGQTVSAEAWALHQPFKRAFVETMPYEGGTISGEAIRAWIEEQRYTRLCELGDRVVADVVAMLNEQPV